jgi:hypothetical protein
MKEQQCHRIVDADVRIENDFLHGLHRCRQLISQIQVPGHKSVLPAAKTELSSGLMIQARP